MEMEKAKLIVIYAILCIFFLNSLFYVEERAFLEKNEGTASFVITVPETYGMPLQAHIIPLPSARNPKVEIATLVETNKGFVLCSLQGEILSFECSTTEVGGAYFADGKYRMAKIRADENGIAYYSSDGKCCYYVSYLTLPRRFEHAMSAFEMEYTPTFQNYDIKCERDKVYATQTYYYTLGYKQHLVYTGPSV